MTQSFKTIILSAITLYVVTSMPIDIRCNGTNCNTLLGGCVGTQYGCCKDNTTKMNYNGTNCITLLGGCVGTQYGCCKDNTTICEWECLNCPIIQ